MSIGQNIKINRIKKDISQTKMAELAGISYNYLSILENNRQKPSILVLTKIAKACDVTLSKLLEE